jgi:NTP pyrophosphatase (non-canonical NTP hydrolase)
MELKEYSVEVQRTFVDLGQKTANDLHMILGLVTEVGELADVYKKKLAYGKLPDMINVQEEIGDIFWYLVNFSILNNFDLGKILQINVDKLWARYPDKFTQERAVNRDLDKERQILEELGYTKEQIEKDLPKQ